MANHKSAKKRTRQTLKRNIINTQVFSKIRTNLNNFNDLLLEKNKAELDKSLSLINSSLAKALKKHGLIQTTWDNGPTDGMGAMVGAWRANGLAQNEGRKLLDYDIMKLIGKYNEVDCKVMQEILYYIREKH